MSSPQAQQKFDFIARSMVLRADKPTKGLDAIPSPNPHQMNRIKGFLLDGTPVMVAQRTGKGGMDFNKLLNGKAYAVAADAMSPVFEKDGEQKSKTQKLEDNVPLYSANGFYLLSSKEYPALDIFEAYTLLLNKGEQVLLLSEQQIEQRQTQTLTSELDLDLLEMGLLELLGGATNLVAVHDEATNKKRKRGIERAKEEAEDAGETYTGADYKELAVSKKDGNAFLLFAWAAKSTRGGGLVLREKSTVTEENRTTTQYFTPEEAIEQFRASADYSKLRKVLEAGEEVFFSFAQGHLMRTSVSFRRKCENVLAAGEASRFGDAVYIHGALKQWTKAVVAIMQSQHPNFPALDYDAHHYVAACRQAEVGMSKSSEGRWAPPQAVSYDLEKALLR